MIYLVSAQKELFNNSEYELISIEKSLLILNSWDVIQYDSETTGRDPHICDLLCAQFGNRKANIQIVVDCTTVSILLYKDILETKLLIGHNLKFDLQFLYKYGVVPLTIFDTMIAEQLLYLGYTRSPMSPDFYDKWHFDFPYKEEIREKIGLCRILNFSLSAVAHKRLHIDIDKTIRGEIIWRGLDTSVIKYAAGDVMYLEDIKELQEKDLLTAGSMLAIQVENNFTPVIAYLEWCGIKLDADKWKEKMNKDQTNLDFYSTKLNNYILENKSKYSQFITKDLQLNLFSSSINEYCNINWSSPKQVGTLLKLMGFNILVEDKETGQLKESIGEKVLAPQKGINDEFLSIYLKYKEYEKVCSTYGQSYLDAINPLTGRIHSTFWQLGASSGRMACGSSQHNTDLARIKGLPESRCGYPQLQNLPSDEPTRAAFVSEKGNLFTSCDFSALESRLGADIYDEPEMLKEFLEGSGDMHSLCAKLVFYEELKDVQVKDIATVRPDLRKKVKSIEFSQQFGGGAKAVASQLGCSRDEALGFVKAYANGFKGIANFKAKGSNFVRSHGYIIMCKSTGHKTYWPDFRIWKTYNDMPEYEKKINFSKDFRDKMDSLAASYDRLALNSPTQGSGIVILKIAMRAFFKWIVNNNYFNKVLLCNLVHDEACIEYPINLKDEVVNSLKICMEKAASIICTKLPIPAKPETSTHWVH